MPVCVDRLFIKRRRGHTAGVSVRVHAGSIPVVALGPGTAGRAEPARLCDIHHLLRGAAAAISAEMDTGGRAVAGVSGAGGDAGVAHPRTAVRGAGGVWPLLLQLFRVCARVGGCARAGRATRHLAECDAGGGSVGYYGRVWCGRLGQPRSERAAMELAVADRVAGGGAAAAGAAAGGDAHRPFSGDRTIAVGKPCIGGPIASALRDGRALPTPPESVLGGHRRSLRRLELRRPAMARRNCR
eukprot:ctg_31.g5